MLANTGLSRSVWASVKSYRVAGLWVGGWAKGWCGGMGTGTKD